MPLPEKALEYLPTAVSELKTSGGWIHCHCFEHATRTTESTEKAHEKIVQKLKPLNVNFEVHFHAWSDQSVPTGTKLRWTYT